MAGASRGKRGGGIGRGGNNNIGRPHISISTDKVETDDPLDFKAPELFPPLRAIVTELEENSEDEDLISFQKKVPETFYKLVPFISREEFTSPWSFLRTIENAYDFPPSLKPKKKKSIKNEKPSHDKQWLEDLKTEISNNDFCLFKEFISAKKSKIDDFLYPTNKKKVKAETVSTTSQLINESVVKEFTEEDDIDVEDNEEPKKKEEDEPKDIDEEFESDIDDELDDETDYNKNYFDNGEGYLDDEDDGLDDNDAIY